MKKLVLLLLLLPTLLNAQIPEPNSDEKCYDKAKRVNVRVNGWECGKLLGVVDCNEKLTFDENSGLILAGNDGTPFTGSCETCFTNGLLERRIKFVNGKEDGPDTTYFRSGCRRIIRNHLQGSENGQWLMYYDSLDQLAWEINYLVGEKHGKSIYFTKDGDTTEWENYSHGLLNGVKRTYYPGTILKKEMTYVNGNLEGPFKYYSQDSTLLDDLNFRAGKKHGTLKYFYNDGNLLKVETWEDGVKNGEFKFFFIQGHVQSVENYKKGLREGEFLDYYPDQSLKRRHVYKKDVLIEDHQFNEEGVEVVTVGKPTNSKPQEDDDAPGTVSEKPKKDKKKKKEKKSKKVKTK
jgi:antitoxin component YwqK of YwqJK toxin-antitoxin module